MLIVCVSSNKNGIGIKQKGHGVMLEEAWPDYKCHSYYQIKTWPRHPEEEQEKCDFLKNIFLLEF